MSGAESSRSWNGTSCSTREPSSCCAACNRARLTADGKLRLCLLRDKELDLLPLLRNGAPDEELKSLIEKSVWYKPWGHGLAEHTYPRHRVMSEIGG